MAGHSKFKNIMHRKGRQDAVRSKLFSKLSREITVAAKAGMPDPAMNPRLRLAIANAKAESMSKDVIDRAIKKAQGGDAPKPQVKESDEKKEVKAGSFSCRRLDVTVNVQGKDYTSASWFAKDVWKIYAGSEHGGLVATEASG